MTTKRTRAPAEALRTFTPEYRPADGRALQRMARVHALSPIGAMVQAAHMLARAKVQAVELIVNESGE